jgi:methionyl-tRNA formyltransferase
VVELTVSKQRPWVVSGSGPVWQAFAECLVARGVPVILHQTKQTPRDTAFLERLQKQGSTVLGYKRFDSPDIQALLSERNVALVVVLFSADILSAQTLAALPCPIINFHPSDLPRYRGPAPFYWQIRAGETQLVVTFHKMSPRIDAGPICLTLPPMPILETDDATCLIWRCAEWVKTYFESIHAVLSSVANENAATPCIVTPQDESKASYQTYPAESDLRIDWGEPAEVLFRNARAAGKAFPLWAVFRGMPVRFRFHGKEAGLGVYANGLPKAPSGTIIRRTVSTITVQTGDPDKAIRLWRPRFYTLPRLLSAALQFVLLWPGACLD